MAVTLGLIAYQTGLSEAASMGTAFTYQGRLLDNDTPAEGIYEMEFKLYDSATDPNQLNGTFSLRSVEVVDGFFIVQLDFGSDVFSGDARWLEIGTRPADTTDPFVTLSPRQELTPTPYALQTRGIFVDDVLNVGIGTTQPGKKLHVESSGVDTIFGKNIASNGKGVHGLASDFSGGGCGVYGESYGPSGFGVFGIAVMSTGVNYGIYGQSQSPEGWAGYFNGRGYFSSNVGIGTTEPSSPLHIKTANASSTGGMRITSSINNNNIIYLQDASPGDQGQVAIRAGGSDKVVLRANGNSSFNGGNIGIGVSTPTGKLQVAGDEVRIGDGGTVNYATGDGDLYVENTLEVDGNAEIGGTVNADNMPGCEYSVGTILLDVPTDAMGLTTITSVSLTLKAGGYVIVTFSGFAQTGLPGDSIKAGIGLTGDSMDNWQVCENQTSGDNVPYSVQYVYSVPSAGTYTYYGNASSAAGTSDIFWATMTAIYVPNRY